jgi:serine/threonine protein kinase/Tfp pilus assembly protein PilF
MDCCCVYLPLKFLLETEMAAAGHGSGPGSNAPEESTSIPHTFASSLPDGTGGEQATREDDPLATCPIVAAPQVDPLPAKPAPDGIDDTLAPLAEADPFTTHWPASENRSTTSQANTVRRFRILKLHARGGLGQVSVAHDDELHREVALKEIQHRYADDPDSRDRFLREARITGRLEHPGIVPVYGLGCSHDGRPYYAMRFIKGDSLEKAIASFHQAERPDDDPGQRSLELHKLLGRFTAICNAMAYAHSHNILHRDLKPANVMLGHFGETLVVDWGLAKALKQPEGNTAAPAALSRPTDIDETVTMMGVAVGTPQFMSPEQAAGQLDGLGPTSDVYSLGATLYCLLTGRAPFEGDDVATILAKVRHGEFPPPHRVKPGVPRALEAICLKAMALRPENRYPTAEALSEDLESWMADEPVSAWREPWYVRARRWINRHRTLVTACSSAAAVALVCLVAVVLLIRAAREREQQRLADLRTEAQKLVFAGEAAMKVQDWQNANLHLTSALAQIGTDPELEDLKVTAEELRTQARQQLEILAARQQAQEQHQRFTRKRDEALFQYGTLFTSMDLQANLQETGAAIDDALALVGVNLAATEPVLWNPQFSKAELEEITEGCYGLLLILAEVKAQAGAGLPPDKKKEALQQALHTLDRAAQVGSASQAYHLRRARYLDLLGQAERAQKESERAQALQPVHAVDFFLLGDEWYKRGRLTEAIVAFDRTLRLQPDHFWAQFFLALRYLESQRSAEARASLTACLSRRPDYPWLYLLRGMVHGGAGEFALAEADFEQALQRHPNPEARYVLWIYRGGMRNRQGKLEAAVADLQQAISLLPDRPQAHEALIQAYLRGKRLDEAKARLDLALQRWPRTASFHRLHARLALARGDFQTALHDFKTAIELQPPESADLADDHLERGRIFFEGKKYAEAVVACAAALKLRPDHTEACLTQVRALLGLHKAAEAARACDHYLEKGQAVAEIYKLRGRARSQQGDHGGAVDDFSRCLVAGTDADLLVERGWEYFECQAWSLALRDFQEALRLDPDNHYALNGRALSYAYTGQYREAVKDGEAALRRTPDSPVRIYNIACVYAVAAAKAAADDRAADRAPLAARYRSRAMDLLQESLELRAEKDRPSFWRDTVQKDTALESIRKEPRYVRLEEQYGIPGKPSP